MAEVYTKEDLSDLSPEELQDLVIETQNEYNALKSNSDRWVSKVLQEKKMLEQVVQLVIDDESKLAEIASKNQDLANKVSQKLYWKEYSDQMKVKNDADVDTIVEQKLMQQKVNDRIDKICSQLPTEEDQKKFREEFFELTDGKKLSNDNIDKFVRASLAVVSDSGNVDISKVKEISVWSWVWSADKSIKSAEHQSRYDYAKQLIS